jgi:hypothetical protein
MTKYVIRFEGAMKIQNVGLNFYSVGHSSYIRVITQGSVTKENTLYHTVELAILSFPAL